MRHITLFVAIIALWTAAAAQTAPAGLETTSARHETAEFTAHPQLLPGSRHALDPDHDRDMMKARDDMEREHQQHMREHEQQMREHELQLREQHKVAPQSAGETFTADGIRYFINSDNNSVTVTYTERWSYSNYNGGSGNLIIPEKVYYNGKYFTVTAIGNEAFYGCSGFTGSLNIPNSVTSIGEYAFYNCKGFTGSLNIPNSVTAIGNSAFLECSGFTGITVEAGNKVYDSRNNCNAIIVTATNTLISGCKNSIIPNSVTAIGDYAFYSCSGFTGSLNIPNSVTSIGKSAFSGCSGFTGSLNIPNSVTSIGNYAFYYCTGFTGSLNIPNSVNTIGDAAFYDCSGFTGSLNIPNSVTAIGNYAFRGCSGFTGSLNIPNSVTAIGNYAFRGCSGFTGSLNIPNSVSSIGSRAFHNCSGFITVKATNTQPADAYSDTFSGVGAILQVPAGCVDIYRNATGWSTFAQITDKDVTAFVYNNLQYTVNKDGNTVTLAGPTDRNSLTSLVIPHTAIYNGKNYPVTIIREYAFDGCSSITGSLNIPNSVTEIGNRAFSGCFGFTGPLTIPNSVTSIGDEAFSSCSGLTGSLTIPNSVTSIGNWAFGYCSGFTGSLNIPNSVTSIGNSAFRYCRGFTGSLNIPNSVTSIGNGAFDGCRGFTGSLNIPNSVTSIGDEAFSSCSGLTGSLTIPNSVASIANYAFSGCSGFTEIHSLNPQPPTVGSSCFYNLDKSIPLYVPAKSIDAYKAADGWKEFYNIKQDLPSLYTDNIYDFFGGEDVVVAVKMKNTMEVAGFQTDIQLPYSMSFVTDSDGYPEIYLSDRASRSHTLGVTSLSGNKVRVLSYSSTNKLYSGNDGDILYFKVKTNWDASIQTYNVTLSNGEIVSPDGTKYAVDKTDIALRCYYIPGDANHDKKVSIADIIAEARYILLQNPYPFHYKSANVNEDNNVSVADIVVTANIILGRYNPDIKFSLPRVMVGDVLSAGVVESRSDGSRTIAIALDGNTGYTAFQADFSLPAGMEVTGARLSDRAGHSHSVAMNRIDGNTVRVLSYASDNAVFAGNSGDLLLLDVKGHGNITFANTLLCEPNGCEHEFEEMTISTELSGINDITVGNGPVNVYNTAGQLVRRNANLETATQGLPAGLYLVGGKKVVVR